MDAYLDDLLRPAAPLLALCAPPKNWAGAPRVVASWAATPTQVPVECAGQEYQRRLRLSLAGDAGYQAAIAAVADAKAAAVAAEVAAKKAAASKKKKGPKFHTIDDYVDEDNYYALLCLPDRHNTPEEVIRENFKQLCIVYHPDKAPEAKREKQEKRFVIMQIAFETLLDETKRRAYESRLDFDDSWPDAEESTEADFFKNWGPCFKRNAIFAETRMPELGGPDQSIDEVNAFYDAWFAMKSWRDFKVKGDHDVSKAEGRDEKRWMEKENDKLKNRLRKEEAVRIRQMVDKAATYDPRFLRWRKEEKARKQAEKDAKETARLAKIAEAEALVRAEQEAKAAAEQAAKDAAENAKKAKEEEKTRAKKLRSAMRKCGESPFWTEYISDDIVEEVAKKLSPDEQSTMLALFAAAVPHCGPDADAAVSGAAPEVQAALAEFQRHYKEGKRVVTELERAAVALKAKARAEAAAKQQADQEKAERAKAAVKPWTRDELSQLAKATTRHPPGTRNRWEVIAQMIGTRTPDEVIAKTKDLQVNSEAAALATRVKSEDAFENFQNNKRALKPDEAKRMDAAVEAPAAPTTAATASASAAAGAAAKEEAPMAPWSKAEMAALETALKKHPASVEGRWDLVAKDLGSRGKKDCMQRFKEMKKLSETDKSAAEWIAAVSVVAAAAPAAAPAKAAASSGKAAAAAPAAAAASAAAPAAAKAGKAPKADAVDSMGWTTAQQLAFEAGLKKYPVGTDGRWGLIADMVPDRTQKECVARFKDVRTKLQAEKAGAESGAASS